jgi:integrase
MTEMKRNVLKANQVLTLPAGVYGDGMGLSLKVGKTGSRSWVYRYRFGGSTKEAGLGSASLVPLAVARAKRDDMLVQLQAGKDPLQIKREVNGLPTFDEAASEFIAAKRPTWKNAKHGQQWENTLKTYASPVIGRLQIDKITSAHVVRVLVPIWQAKHETATRVLSRIHMVLGAARYRAGLTGTNPAEWKGYLENDIALSHNPKVKHFASLTHCQTGKVLRALMESSRVSDLALAFTILTAARTGSVIGAKWEEIDEEAAVWRIPSERMKMGVAFDIPLSEAAMQLLATLKELHPVWIFPSPSKPSQHVSNAAMGVALRRFVVQSVAVPHGFRATFRTWAGDIGVDFEISEECLAHSKGDSVVKAYHRTTMIERRRAVMERWANYLTTPILANVVSLRKNN